MFVDNDDLYDLYPLILAISHLYDFAPCEIWFVNRMVEIETAERLYDKLCPNYAYPYPNQELPMSKMKTISLLSVLSVIVASFFAVRPAAAGGGVNITYLSATCSGVSALIQNNSGASISVLLWDITDNVVTNNVPLANGATITLSVSFGPDIVGTAEIIDVDVNGSATPAFTYNCTAANVISAPGPTIPSNFVLRTILCNTPIYVTPGGVRVPTGEIITLNQTWFVNPIQVVINKQSWTEVFDGGYINGFIPTSCVGGKPSGYAGT
jgi:hypothetical protein